MAGEEIASSGAIDAMNSQELFDYSYPVLLHKLYDITPVRSADCSFNTIADRLYLLEWYSCPAP